MSSAPSYLPILIFIFVALGFGTVSLLAGRVLRPRAPYQEKLYPYESGIHPLTDARQTFPLRYYITAMLFVIFDIEVVFLYPWAVSFYQLGGVALLSMLFFIGILLVGFFYAWQKGAFVWD